MADMPISPAHAKPVSRRDHHWVLAIIAASVLAEVWASWVGIGAISGFPKIGGIPTDWVLAVAMEAYWGYALYAWLVASPGPRSRSMAMWSCAVVFVFSLIGQILYHEITAPAGTQPGGRVVIGFVTSLPIVVLALIAVLIHLRHLDRAEAMEAADAEAREARRVAVEEAETDERAALHAQLEAAVTARDGAQQEAAAALTQADTLARKLATASASKRGGGGARQKPASDRAAKRAKAVELLRANPAMSRADVVRLSGVSERTADRVRAELNAGAHVIPMERRA